MSSPADLAALARGVIAVGFTGSTPAEAPLAALRAFGPGAVILFARNAGAPAQLRDLIAALRGLATPAPLIAVDQEGGRVERIAEGVAALPPAMAVGATGDVVLAERLGRLLGRDLARLGFSVDLAPVADLALHPRSTVVGTRAFGDEPDRVAAFAGAFARGLERAGIAAALKHFPGHGSTADDSHVVLPRVDADAATLRARDLVPFARAIAARAASIVMTAHVVIEAFDRDKPATLSRPVLTGLLREELGFDGVIATDCLEMDAIASDVGTVRGAVEALAAGADLLFISHRLEIAHEAAEAIAAAVRAGEIPPARLQDAHARVHALRSRPVMPEPAEQLDEEWPLEAARRAVTALRRRGWKSEVMRVPLEPAADDVDLLVEHIPQLGDREFVLATRDAHVFPGQRDAVARILGRAPDALIVSSRSPYDALLWPRARRVVCIYGTQPISLEGCADVLTGRAPAGGTLPVRLAANAAVR